MKRNRQITTTTTKKKKKEEIPSNSKLYTTQPNAIEREQRGKNEFFFFVRENYG